jgi:ubiquitin C-terminal hydrolase
MYLYDLFCVINHEGAIDNGHYTNFARYAEEVSMTARSSGFSSKDSQLVVSV